MWIGDWSGRGARTWPERVAVVDVARGDAGRFSDRALQRPRRVAAPASSARVFVPTELAARGVAPRLLLSTVDAEPIVAPAGCACTPCRRSPAAVGWCSCPLGRRGRARAPRARAAVPADRQLPAIRRGRSVVVALPHQRLSPNPFLHGGRSRDLVDWAHVRIAGSELHGFAGCGRSVQLDCPREYNAVVEAFLAKVGKVAQGTQYQLGSSPS